MTLGRTALALTAAAGLLTVAPTAGAATPQPLDQCSAADHQGDARLGPEQLPLLGRVGLELIGYQRTGGESDQAFLARYYDSRAGSWNYPPDNGYALTPDGQPIEIEQELLPGQDIDRYGSEYGSFLAPEGLPYAERSIPPQSLDSTTAPAGCNYHDYRVVKPFEVHAGPIAPWFDQPGWGWQYQLDGTLLPGAPAQLNVGWLVTNGYLERLV
ncbi:TNT domain-containing protein [Kitasatospora sp. NPDC052896]|uniref:TNT domain-containing protein n=1 Tax=Kitasatospora sp. NPDC052896 TaxID=3364061 RepID=UPI0037C8DDB3